MISYQAFFSYLSTTPLADIAADLEPLSVDRLQPSAHGDLARWQTAIASLPELTPHSLELDRESVRIGGADQLSPGVAHALREALMRLHPWRKGPFEVFGLRIDAEWRSNVKWERFQDKIAPLHDRVILDVGCGNGYYLLRMLGRGARVVVGVDANMLHVMQFQALNRFVRTERGAVLPLSVEQVPRQCECFDTVFSMGVLYHQRQPLDHLRRLSSFLKARGQLVLETLVWNCPRADALNPKGRYAQMRNVWSIPSPTLLRQWLEAAGFCRIEWIDTSATTAAEQRQTEWMTYASLTDFLLPDDPNKTVEGYPAPLRAVVLADRG